jgi:hypothetical protein
MAYYVAECKYCGKEQTYRKPIEKREETPSCCGVPMQRKLSAPMGFVDVPAVRK